MYGPVKGHTHQHDPKYHHAEHRDRHHKDHGGPDIYCESHDHCPKHHKGGTQQQAQGHIDSVLYLIDIAGHPGDHGGGAYGIDLPIGQTAYMGKQVVPQGCGHAGGGFCGKILGGQGTGQPNQSQQKKESAHLKNIGIIMVLDPHIHHTGDHKRHKQLKAGLQHLKQGTQDTLLFIFPHITQQSFHTQTPFCRISALYLPGSCGHCHVSYIAFLHIAIFCTVWYYIIGITILKILF